MIDPCAEVDCSEWPAPACEGDVAVRITAGACVEGDCEYTRIEDDCSVVGRVCFEGACVDRCDIVTCDEPPPGRCEGPVAIAYQSAGTCLAATGECAYSVASRTACITTPGEFCVAGTCVDGGACGVTGDCDAPDPVCAGDVAITFVDPSCDGGACVWQQDRTDCADEGLRCFDGACAADAPCEGVICDDAPAPACEGDVAVVVDPAGRCFGGECRYEVTRTDCADLDGICTDGVCRTDLCDGVTCDTVPEPTCRGNVAVTASAGSCRRDGVCVYPESRVDCAALGFVCEDGGCVDRCAGVSCEDAAAPYCDRNIAVTPEGPGVCAFGTCEYAESRVNCSSLGLFCEAGACVASSPCRGVVCDDPPPATCDGDTRVTYADSGACSGGFCSYAVTTLDCTVTGRVCFAGACIDACAGDPCDRPPGPTCADATSVRVWNPTGACVDGACSYTDAEVECDTPPPSFCEGELAVSFRDDGTCESGACRYEREYEDCPAVAGGACVDGACVVIDPCDDVACDSPPPPRCEAGLSLSYASTGTCRLGVCSYALVVNDCTSVAGGACIDGLCFDPCAGVECAPTGTCFGTVSRQAPEAGRCYAGACEYDFVDVECAAVIGGTCEDGYCVDPCADEPCDVPPDSFCVDDTLHTWEVPGTCTGGTCDFVEVTVACDTILGGRCEAGACVTECDDGCFDPPAPRCEGDLAFRYDAAPGCIDGLCNYPLEVLDCSAIPGGTCADGACVDPCADVVCATPPPATCEGGGVSIAFESAGTCRAGVCTYAEVVENCTAVLGGTCVDGYCVDPCEGIVCDEPPPGTCNGGTLEGYEPIGYCELGTCIYPRRNTPCNELLGGSCVDGACVTSCDDGCSSPPPDECSSDVLIAYDTDGTCVSGVCIYDTEAIDCVARGGGECVDGACTDPCEGVTCAPPPDDCDGLLRRFVVEAGECFGGSCMWDYDFEDCAATPGGFCDRGRCIDPCDTEPCTTPPTGTCDGDVRFGFEDIGACFAGECTYLALDPVNCGTEFRGTCEDGRCLTECDLGCPTVPASFCRGTDLIEAVQTGCNDGICEFGEAPLSCPGELGPNWICESGACVDTCGDVECTELPPSTCVAGVFTQVPAGACSLGSCRYDPVTVGCPGTNGDICNGSRCVADGRCDSLQCDTPPAPACSIDGRSRIVFGAGTCAAGECDWAETVTPCASGTRCEAGVCVSVPTTCAAVVCNTPPASSCEGEIAVTHAPGIGTCEVDGGVAECEYGDLMTRTDCAFTGQNCVAGACVTVPDPAVGDLQIVELMNQPVTGTGSEFVEIVNRSSRSVRLDNVRLQNPASPTVFAQLSGVVPAGATFVVSRGGDDLEAIVPDGVPVVRWESAYTLPNATGIVELVVGTTVLHRVEWGAGWPVRTGSALAALPGTSLGDSVSPAAWCSAGALYGPAGRGSPGRSNDDCVFRAADTAVEGDLVITEFHAAPDGLFQNSGDFFEVRNDGPLYLDLNGLTVSTATSDSTVTGTLVIAPGEIITVAASGAAAGGLVDVVVPALRLDGSGDVITIGGSFGALATLAFSGDWPLSGTASAQLDARYPYLYERPDLWCPSIASYAGALLGTPGRPNRACPGIEGVCTADADCGAARYCIGNTRVERVATGTCDLADATCDFAGDPYVHTPCGALTCYDGECVDP